MDASENRLILKNVRVVFPNLLEPKPVMRNGRAVGEPVYSITLLLDQEHVDEAKPIAVKVAKEKWPSRNFGEDIATGQFNWPFKDGNKVKADAEKKGKNGDFYADKTVLKASSKFPPGLLDEKKRVVDPNVPFSKNLFYSGCYCHVEIAFNAYDGVSGGADGVKVYLQNVMKAGDGERLIGRSVQDVFAGIEGGASDEDPTGAEPAYDF